MMNRKVLFWQFLRSFGSKRPRSSGRRCCGDVVHCASRGSQPRRPDDGTGNGNAHGRRHEHRDAGHDEEDDAHPECGGEEGHSILGILLQKKGVWCSKSSIIYPLPCFSQCRIVYNNRCSIAMEHYRMKSLLRARAGTKALKNSSLRHILV